MLLMTLRDLQYRARRVGLVTVLVALVLTLLYLMTGLAHHLSNEPYDALDNVGASSWILVEGVGGPFTAASALPLSVEATLEERTDGVVEPVVVTRGALAAPPDNDETLEVQVIGHRIGALGQPTVVSGTGISGPGQIVLDRSLDVDVGSEVEIGVERFEVVGLTSDSTVLAGQAFGFVELATAQQMAFQNDTVVTGFVSDGGFTTGDGFSILTPDDVAEETLGPIESAVASIDLIRILLWFVAAIVMGAVIYLTALERQRDFAVLKAVGASGRSLGAGLAVQAVVIALIASITAAVAATLIEPVFPLPVTIPASALVTVPAIAVVVGLLSAMLGVRKVNRTDPAEAFS
jgi:putative ABC transport system permease protein